MTNNNVLSNVSHIKNEEVPEFVGQIIDIFEDFLKEKNINIENPEKSEIEDNEAIIYGSDYDSLRDSLVSMMKAWDIIDEEVLPGNSNANLDSLMLKMMIDSYDKNIH